MLRTQIAWGSFPSSPVWLPAHRCRGSKTPFWIQLVKQEDCWCRDDAACACGQKDRQPAACALLPVKPSPPWYAIRKVKPVPCSLWWKISSLVVEMWKQASGDMGGGYFERNSCGRELMVSYDFADFVEHLVVQHREELRIEQKYMLLPHNAHTASSDLQLRDVLF